jgi:peptidoglycan/xylan/chitin deacetylase (PgdA/CDA1 family)
MILAYHEITQESSRYRYSVSRDLLDAHLQIVAGFREYHRGMVSAPEVTFDDGERSNYVHGLGLLEKHSLKATFFVIAGWMGSQHGFMTWPELREIVSLGHQVQSHGWSHRALTERSDSELREELDRSKRTLEDHLGVPVDALSVPYGRWDDRLLRACAAAGYRRVYISNPWMPPQQREGVELPGRYMVQRSLKARQLRRLLAGDPAYRFFLRSQYRMKEMLRSSIGHAAYHRLWLFLAGTDDVNTQVIE